LSSDYDSPLSEAGDVTDKYMMSRQIFAPHNTLFGLFFSLQVFFHTPRLTIFSALPHIPHAPTKAAYGRRHCCSVSFLFIVPFH
jgi:hypothetical protein